MKYISIHENSECQGCGIFSEVKPLPVYSGEENHPFISWLCWECLYLRSMLMGKGSLQGEEVEYE